MKKKKQVRKIGWLEMLRERFVYYILGFVVSGLIMWLNIMMEANVDLASNLTLLISCSFVFGHLIYMMMEESAALKKNTWGMVLSRESLMNFALSFSSIVVFGVIFQIIL